jgi:CRP-like cAMP-binding protein
MGSPSTSAAIGSLLDLDPDLGAGVPAEDLDDARQACRGRIVRLAHARWDPAADPTASEHDDVAYVIVNGLLCREIAIDSCSMLELLGPGDVFQPPVNPAGALIGGGITVTTASGTLLVAVGSSFMRASARWPSLLRGLLERIEAQRERVAYQGLIAHLPRAEHRLLLVLWHLAERWGRVTPRGTLLPLPLTHTLLGQLIGARRPTVTLAVSALHAEGLLHRTDGRAWLLAPGAGDKVAAICRTSLAAPIFGETLTLQRHSFDLREESQALWAQASQLRARTATN